MDFKGYIPKNVCDFGYVFGGMIKVRNAVEAGAGLFLVFVIVKLLIFIPLVPRLIIGFILAGIVIAVSLIGVEGVSLTTYLIDLMLYHKSKGRYIYKIPRPESEKGKGRKRGNKNEKDC